MNFKSKALKITKTETTIHTGSTNGDIIRYGSFINTKNESITLNLWIKDTSSNLFYLNTVNVLQFGTSESRIEWTGDILVLESGVKLVGTAQNESNNIDNAVDAFISYLEQ